MRRWRACIPCCQSNIHICGNIQCPRQQLPVATKSLVCFADIAIANDDRQLHQILMQSVSNFHCPSCKGLHPDMQGSGAKYNYFWAFWTSFSSELTRTTHRVLGLLWKVYPVVRNSSHTGIIGVDTLKMWTAWKCRMLQFFVSKMVGA